MIIPFFMGHFEILQSRAEAQVHFFRCFVPLHSAGRATARIIDPGHHAKHPFKRKDSWAPGPPGGFPWGYTMIYPSWRVYVFPLENPMFKHKCVSMDMGTMHWKPPSAIHLFDLYVHRIQIHMLSFETLRFTSEPYSAKRAKGTWRNGKNQELQQKQQLQQCQQQQQ